MKASSIDDLVAMRRITIAEADELASLMDAMAAARTNRVQFIAAQRLDAAVRRLNRRMFWRGLREGAALGPLWRWIARRFR